MNKKDILMVVVISAVVGVVASLVTTNISGDVSLSPRRVIIADACNGDKVCEMNNALINGSLEVYDLIVDDATIANRLEADEAKIGGMFVEDDLEVGDSLIVGGGVFVEGTSVFKSGGNDTMLVTIAPNFGDPISGTAYVGRGTGYACISAHGSIFRSEGPCI